MSRYAGWLAACLLTACSHIRYTSRCGLRVSDDPDAPTQAATNYVEAAAVRQGLYRCEQLRGIVVRTLEWTAWKNSAGMGTAGETQCAGVHNFSFSNKVVIGNARKYPLSGGALAHELVHGVQCPVSNYEHEGWVDAGTHGRISAANRDAADAGF